MFARNQFQKMDGFLANDHHSVNLVTGPKTLTFIQHLFSSNMPINCICLGASYMKRAKNKTEVAELEREFFGCDICCPASSA